MTNKDKWNKIVELYNQHKYSKEEAVQKTWENIFSELFGYGKLFGEIDIHRSVKTGSTEKVITDIIIRDEEKDLFIVEVKQHVLDSGTEQLFSYLKLLHNDIGLLINKKITIFAYDYNRKDNDQIKYEINFESDSIAGEEFVDLFCKPFQTSRVREYIIQKNNSKSNVLKIKNQIDIKYIVNLVTHDLSTEYNQIEISEALKGIQINVVHFDHQPAPSEPIIMQQKLQILQPADNQTNIKIGEAVRSFFSRASLNNSLSKALINKLCDKDYCYQKFNISLPVLIELNDPSLIDKYRKDKYGYGRYYKQPIMLFNQLYILCSQWTTLHEPSFYRWVNSIDK